MWTFCLCEGGHPALLPAIVWIVHGRRSCNAIVTAWTPRTRQAPPALQLTRMFPGPTKGERRQVMERLPSLSKVVIGSQAEM